MNLIDGAKPRRVATLWWRDDDAVMPTRQLDWLLRVAGTTPIGLAVIPALARRELVAALGTRRNVAVLQHGWQHANRAVHGKKCEYPETRPVNIVGAELAAGRARLRALFGSAGVAGLCAAVESHRRRLSAAARQPAG